MLPGWEIFGAEICSAFLASGVGKITRLRMRTMYRQTRRTHENLLHCPEHPGTCWRPFECTAALGVSGALRPQSVAIFPVLAWCRGIPGARDPRRGSGCHAPLRLRPHAIAAECYLLPRLRVFGAVKWSAACETKSVPFHRHVEVSGPLTLESKSRWSSGYDVSRTRGRLRVRAPVWH